MTAWDDGGVAWRSGSWTLERRGDELADLAYAGRRVLRSVRAVVRDADWNTADWLVDEPVDRDGVLRIPVRSQGYGSDIRGDVVVEVRDRTLSVTFDAVSHAAFSTNRTGLVVLHPPGVGGAPLRVRHPDATVSDTAFPVAISAHQPVFDVAGLEWCDDGLDIRVDFSGDVFEIEDQRNWTDASFKTYSRPLALPFPYALAPGERVRQRIDVTVGLRSATADPGPAAEAPGIRLLPAGIFPTVGAAASTAPDPEPPLPPARGDLLVELDLAAANWRAALSRAARRGVPLDVRLTLPHPDPAALADVAEALRGVRLARIAIFHPFFHVSDAESVRALRTALDAAGLTVPVVGGSRSHFTELNREHARMPDDLREIVTTVTPLFHALSSAQLIESVAMQRLVAEQTVAHARGLPVRIGPVTLRPRFNDVATAPQSRPHLPDLSRGYGAQYTGAVDPRQSTRELAAWTVASAAALCIAGVAGVAYYEEWGPRGIRDDSGAAYPVAEVLDALAALAGAELLTGESPDGLLWALGARMPTGTVVLAANLHRAERTLSLRVDGAAPVSVRLAPLSWTCVRPG